MARKDIYDSTALEIASDTDYTVAGDIYDGSPVKIVPSVGLLRQFARPKRQQPGQYMNWVLNQIAQVALGLIDHTAELEDADAAEAATRAAIDTWMQADYNASDAAINANYQAADIAAAALEADYRAILYADYQAADALILADSRRVRTETAAFNLHDPAIDSTIILNPAAPFALQLSDPAACSGIHVRLINKDGLMSLANAVSITPYSAELINGISVPYILGAANGSWTIVSDGVDWTVL